MAGAGAGQLSGPVDGGARQTYEMLYAEGEDLAAKLVETAMVAERNQDYLKKAMVREHGLACGSGGVQPYLIWQARAEVARERCAGAWSVLYEHGRLHLDSWI